jgi:hypothetical protein
MFSCFISPRSVQADGSGGVEAFRSAAAVAGMTILASVTIFNDQRTFITQSEPFGLDCGSFTPHAIASSLCACAQEDASYTYVMYGWAWTCTWLYAFRHDVHVHVHVHARVDVIFARPMVASATPWNLHVLERRRVRLTWCTVADLGRSNARVIYIVTQAKDAGSFLRAAYHAGIGGPGFLWFSGNAIINPDTWETDAGGMQEDLTLRLNVMKGFFGMTPSRGVGSGPYTEYLQ